MEYTCFKCLTKVRGGVKHLFSHLKFIHGLNSGSKQKITCIQDGCTEVFSYCSSYKRHILAKHAHKVKQPTSLHWVYLTLCISNELFMEGAVGRVMYKMWIPCQQVKIIEHTRVCCLILTSFPCCVLSQIITSQEGQAIPTALNCAPAIIYFFNSNSSFFYFPKMS